MTDSWSYARLGELIDIKHGFAFKGQYFRDEPTGYLLLTPGNFAIGGGFQLGKGKYYEGPVPAEFLLKGSDLLVTMTDLSKSGDTLGYPAIIPASSGIKYLHNQRIGKVLVKDEKRIDKRFLFYLLCSREYRDEVLASATGTAVKHTAPVRIQAFGRLIPPIEEQCTIARLLGLLDDKIELNRQTNQTLEAMASSTFKSWFMDFDPVIAKTDGRRPYGMNADTAGLFPVSFEDSQIGPSPRGWRVATLSELCEINPSRTLKKGQLAPYLDMANMPTIGHFPHGWIERPFGSGMKFTNGDTLVARITPCLENGKTAFVNFLTDGEVGWGSTEYIVLRPKSPLPEVFAYCLARTSAFRDFAIQSMTGSSGRQRVAGDSIKRYLLAAPTPDVASAFGAMVNPLFIRAAENMREASTLAALRDTLLPKLLSGEIRVKQAEKLLEAV